MFARRSLLAIVAALSLAQVALAHSILKSSTPASGATLAGSPDKVILEFNESARITSAVAVADGRPDQKLEIAPRANAQVFSIQTPDLPPGRNEIRWKALSKDGHVISGAVIITIRPESGAAPAAGRPPSGR